MQVLKIPSLIILFSLFAIFPVFPQSEKESSVSTLTIWDFKYNDARTRRVYDKIDENFRKLHPEITLVHVGFAEEEYIPSLRSALLAGTGPDVIWLHQGAEILEFGSYLEPLSAYISASQLQFRERSLAVGISQDNLLRALPVSFQGMGWYYNKDLFRKAGLDPDNPPQDWESFLEACRILKEKGITPIAAGNNRPLTTDFIRRSLITAFFTDAEIESFFSQGKGVLSAEFRTIMTFLVELMDNGFISPDGVFQPYFNYAGDIFAQGEAAFIMGLLSDISHWKEFSDALGVGSVGYFPNLSHPDMKRPGVQLLQDAGLTIGINSKSDNKGLAYSYIENLYTEASQELLVTDLGMLMPLKNLHLPKETYPVLSDIEAALSYTGYDIEQFTPSTFIRDVIYRYDTILLNTKEVSLQDYLQHLFAVVQFF